MLAKYAAELGEIPPDLLPLDHPETMRVHRVVDRLLEANNLGRIKTTLVTRESDQTGWFFC